MTTPDSDEPLVPDGWELHASRAATLHLDSKRYRLKAPTLGELRQVTEWVQEANDSITDLSYTLDGQLTEVRKRRDAGEIEEAERSRENRRLGRELDAFAESTFFETLSRVFDLLGSAMPDPDRTPAWFVTGASEQISTLITHWRTAPPHRGGAPARKG